MKFVKELSDAFLSVLALFVLIIFSSCEEREAPHTHSFSEWSPVIEAKCNTDGLKTKRCSCGLEISEAIPKTNEHYYTEHSFIAPSCASDGRRELVCADCAHVVTELIERIGHNCVDGVCSYCGGESAVYFVRVIDGLGLPISNAYVTLYSGDTEMECALTDESRVAKFTLLRSDYRFEISSDSHTFDYDEELCVLTPQKTDVTVNTYGVLSNTVRVLAPDGTDENAYVVGEHSYRVNFLGERMSYFVFLPTLTGIYSVSIDSESEVFVGYYGTPELVLSEDLTENINRVSASGILIDVGRFNVASHTNEATPFVIGILASEDSLGVLKIERIGEHKQTPSEIPYTVYGEDVKPSIYAPKEASIPGFSVTDLDLLRSDLQIVYSEKDGLYHYMNALGPVVLVKLCVATPYLDAISEMCRTAHFACTLLDEGGGVLLKETYHEMLLRYIEASSYEAGGLGLYPLDVHLMRAIKNVGASLGWWNFNTGCHIFGEEWDKIVANPENAWMFLLCYAELLPIEHTVSVTDAFGAPICELELSIVDDEGFAIASATTDAFGCAKLVFLHTPTCFVTFSDEISDKYAVLSDGYRLYSDTLHIVLAEKDENGKPKVYDPTLKYVKYNWKTTDVNVRINENSQNGRFTSLYRRFFEGPESEICKVDTLVRLRNLKMSATVKCNIVYSYRTDLNTEYAWSRAGGSIVNEIFALGASAPDIFVDSIYDLMYAALKGCFMNISSPAEGKNNLSFIERGFGISGERYGYMTELMDALALSPTKRYILASDYFIDTVRALNVIPVNTVLLSEMGISMSTEDRNGNGRFDISDFALAIEEGSWTYTSLMQLSAAANELLTDIGGIVLDCSYNTAQALIGSADCEMLRRDFSNGLDTPSFSYDSSSFAVSFFKSLDEVVQCGGVKVESVGYDDLRSRFVSGGLLFGGIVTLSMLEGEEYKDLISDGLFIAPVPKVNADDEYVSSLDSAARLCAVNISSAKIAEATAYLDYQSTESSEVRRAYINLFTDAVGLNDENSKSVELIIKSFRPSLTMLYDDVICAYFGGENPTVNDASWAILIAKYGFSLLNAEMIYKENVMLKEKYLSELCELIYHLP